MQSVPHPEATMFSANDVGNIVWELSDALDDFIVDRMPLLPYMLNMAPLREAVQKNAAIGRAVTRCLKHRNTIRW